MKCRFCGKTIPDNAIFCPSCGKKIESHLRAEDRVEYEFKNEYEHEHEHEHEEPKGKRRLKAFISIIAAILFVSAAFIAMMHFVKPFLGEEPWGDSKDQTAETEEIIAEPVTMYISAEDGSMLLSGPGQDNEAIHVLDYGQEMQVERTEDGWAYGTADGVPGWCSAESLTEEKIEVQHKEKTPESDADKGKLVEPSKRIGSGYRWAVNSEGGLNLRCGPGQEYDILLVVPDKAEVTEEGRDGYWLFVKYEGEYGWVNLEYIIPVNAE